MYPTEETTFGLSRNKNVPLSFHLVSGQARKQGKREDTGYEIAVSNKFVFAVSTAVWTAKFTSVLKPEESKGLSLMTLLFLLIWKEPLAFIYRSKISFRVTWISGRRTVAFLISSYFFQNQCLVNYYKYTANMTNWQWF